MCQLHADGSTKDSSDEENVNFNEVFDYSKDRSVTFNVPVMFDIQIFGLLKKHKNYFLKVTCPPMQDRYTWKWKLIQYSTGTVGIYIPASATNWLVGIRYR